MVFESYQLKCYEPTLYTIVTGADNRCVAPTARSIRCPWRITYRDLQECLNLESTARNLVDSDERHDVLCNLVLLRCCEQVTHREKLTYDDSGCLDQVAREFGISIPAKIAVKIEVGETRCRVQHSLEHALSAEDSSSKRVSDHRELLPEGPAPRYELRFRRATSSANQAGIVFIPYVTDPKDSVKGDLLCDVPFNYARTGHVYAFTWPSNPDYIKIGYTSNSSQSRVLEWQSCHPGATLCVSIEFDFPKRMERLIHLQMAKHRHKIVKCKNCLKTHFEWFKLSIEDVSQVIQDWEKVNTKEPFYDSTWALTRAWRLRIQSMTNEITAGSLLAILDAEEKQRQDSRGIAAIPVQASDTLIRAPKVAIEHLALLQAPTLDSSPKEIGKGATNNPPSPPEIENPKPSQCIVSAPDRPVALPQLPSVAFTFTRTLQADKEEKEPTIRALPSVSSPTTTGVKESTSLPQLPSVPFTFTSNFEATGRGKVSPVSTSSSARLITLGGSTLLPSLPSVPFTFTHTLQANKEEKRETAPTLSSFPFTRSPPAAAIATQDEPTPLLSLPAVPSDTPISSQNETPIPPPSSAISPSASTETYSPEEDLILPSVPSHSPAKPLQVDQHEKELAVPISVQAALPLFSSVSSNDTSQRVESVTLPVEILSDPPTVTTAAKDVLNKDNTEKLEEQILTIFSDFMFMLAMQSNQLGAPEMDLTKPPTAAAEPTTAALARVAVAV